MKVLLNHTLENAPNALVVPISGKQGLLEALKIITPITPLHTDLLNQDFKGDQGEIQVLYTSTGRLFLVGIGEKPAFDTILKTFRTFSFKYKSKLPPSFGISFLHFSDDELTPNWIEAVFSGLRLGAYRVGVYKTKSFPSHPLDSPDAEIELFVSEKVAAFAHQSSTRGTVIADTQHQILDLVNAPSNKKIPEVLAEWAKKSGKTYGYKVTVFEMPQIKENGLEALLAVNRGSDDPAVFIIMEYIPSQKPAKKIGLVGKGVTFDTGGLSIKPSSNMHYMKSDMGGAAAVFGTMELAARLQLPIHLIGIVPATDNSVDAKSVKPGDVIGSHSGKTIEIIDTDAEGRLILADGLSYIIKNYQPDILIDLATLTGSAVRTLGYHAGALFTKNQALSRQFTEAGQQSGEKVWPLPLWDVYRDDLKSDVADIKNYSGKPIAGAIAAAKFLEFFVEEHPNWVHMDIAGVAFSDTEFTSQKSATAFGIRLLITFIENLLLDQ